MTPESFCYWLQGFFELQNPKTITPEQVAVIKEHLALVFTKVTQLSVDDESLKSQAKSYPTTRIKISTNVGERIHKQAKALADMKEGETNATNYENTQNPNLETSEKFDDIFNRVFNLIEKDIDKSIDKLVNPELKDTKPENSAKLSGYPITYC